MESACTISNLLIYCIGFSFGKFKGGVLYSMHQSTYMPLSICSSVRKCTQIYCCNNTGRVNYSSSTKKSISDSKATLKENWLNSFSYPLTTLSQQLSYNNETDLCCNTDMKWVVGIDPDVSGALAVLKYDGSKCDAEVFDTPSLHVYIGKNRRRRPDAKSIVQLVQGLNAPIGTCAYIEESRPLPLDGKLGWWCSGLGYGLWVGILVACRFSVVPVSSVVWKNQFGLPGGKSGKDDSRRVASSLFPSLHSSLKRKKDHGRAEAVLIAAYGRGPEMDLNSGLVSLVEDDSQVVR